MSQGNAGAAVVGSLIIGVSIVAGSMLLRTSLAELGGEIASLKGVISEASAPKAPPERVAQRPSRPDERRRYSVVTEGSPVRGDVDAKLSIVEFSDFECPFCNRVNPTLLTLLDEYEGKVRVIFKHLPLSIHRRARDAHLASEAAHRQGKFWEMHDKIFADQRRMSPEIYREYATELGLDLAQYDRDLASDEVARKVDADAAEAARLGVSGTPSFFINGRFVSGALPVESFRGIIDEELGGSPTAAKPGADEDGEEKG